MSSRNNGSARGNGKSPNRWIDLPEEEKREVLRRRNVDQCRKNRQKWRDNDKEMQELYDKNEKKIEQLERMAERLSAELEQAQSSSSSKSRSKSKSTK